LGDTIKTLDKKYLPACGFDQLDRRHRNAYEFRQAHGNKLCTYNTIEIITRREFCHIFLGSISDQRFWASATYGSAMI